MNAPVLPIECVCLILEQSDAITKIRFSQINSEFYCEIFNYVSTNVRRAVRQQDVLSISKFTSTEWIDQTIALSDICRINNFGLVLHFMNVCQDIYSEDLEDAMYTSAEIGNLPMFEHMLTLVSHTLETIRRLIQCACIGGNMDILDICVWLYEQNKPFGPDFETENPGVKYPLLYSACRGGNLEMVQALLNLGFSEYEEGLLGASEGGHLEIAEMMCGLGVIDQRVMEHAACFASRNGHREVAEYFIGLGVSNFASIFLNACQSPNSDWCEYALSLVGDLVNDEFLDLCLDKACRSGHYEIVVELLKRGALVCDYTFVEACKSENMDLINLLMPKFSNYEHGFYVACLSGNMKLVNLLATKCKRLPTDIYILKDREIMKIITEHGIELI